MTEKKKENQFEFALFINGKKIIGRYFDADCYNPKIRNSVDIRDMSDSIIKQIQDTLRMKDIQYIHEKYDLSEPSHITLMKKWGETGNKH